MKYYSEENKAVIKSWCNNPEEGAVNQARNLASLPFLFKHVALMPDTHQGYGMPIGGVIATKNVIIPNAVGVDIGCGMCAIKTTLTDITTDQLKIILSEIRKVIPVGFEKHKKERSDNLMPDVNSSSNSMIDWCSSHDWNEHYNSVVQKQYSKATQQLGTLGGGNHFIEIQRGRENINDVGNIWIMIHSGSRNLGYKVAKHYNKVAQDLCNKWCSNIPEYTGQDGLAFLPVDTEEGQNYIKEMNYCLAFAYANRKLMMTNIIQVLVTQGLFDNDFTGLQKTRDSFINIHHNYANLENHFGENVWVHRKGATSANEGQLGIIPGSQGTASYIVKGKGNTDSFKSCSHGAGRQMSRTKARNELNFKEEVSKLNNQGIIHSIRDVSSLDEASGAYKDIDVVMKEQEDLVDIVVKLQPLAVIKG